MNNWAQMVLSKKLQEDGRPVKSHHSSGPFKPSTLPGGCIEQNRGTLNREEKLLRHVAMVAKFLDDNKSKRHLKSGFAPFQTSSTLFTFI